MARKLLWFAPIIILIGACSHQEADRPPLSATPPPLVDTLVTIFRELKQAALSNRPDRLANILDTAEARRLTLACHVYGVSAIGQYYETRFGGWPDPDTLTLTDLTLNPPFARVALCGQAARMGTHADRIKYTFLLFRRVKSNWRLASISTLEKNRYDQYGTELGYMETELPPELRFPRIF